MDVELREADVARFVQNLESLQGVLASSERATTEEDVFVLYLRLEMTGQFINNAAVGEKKGARKGSSSRSALADLL